MSGEYKPTVISLFAGCGGSSLGYLMAGFQELLAVDFDPLACKTFQLNFPDVPCWTTDIRELSGEKILNECGLKKGELDVLDSSPPCQGFSGMRGKRRIGDPRNLLPFEVVRLLRELRPRMFVMENVPYMAMGQAKGIFRELMCAFRDVGYDVECRLLDAAFYNVPQTRKRLIWLGTRDNLPLLWPQRCKIILLREAFKNIPDGLGPSPLGERMKARIKYLKSGQTGQCLFGAGQWFSYRRLRWDRPSYTISSEVYSHYHPNENRRLTIPELKRICSFPDSFQFFGSYMQQGKQIGNAVPPRMMEAIACKVKDSLNYKNHNKEILR